MKDFTSSLLREKFVILDPKIADVEKRSTVALSNRFIVELRNAAGRISETYIVRGHNMHSVVRMATRILYAFNNGGALSTRASPYDWEQAWDSIVNDYEYAYNPQRWITIYKDGKCVFSAGEYHPFLDMIEKCDHENKQEYDYSIPMAEALFKQAGKDVQISHDSNVALTVHFEGDQGRCGIILRGSNRTTTFSFSTRPKEQKQILNIAQCLGSAAAFLEAVQLAFLIGMNVEKIRIGIIERFSKEEKQTREGRQRLQRLTSEIANLESAFDVRYRPEKPEFHLMMAEAEALAQRVLEPPRKEDTQDSDEYITEEAPPEE